MSYICSVSASIQKISSFAKFYGLPSNIHAQPVSRAHCEVFLSEKPAGFNGVLGAYAYAYATATQRHSNSCISPVALQIKLELFPGKTASSLDHRNRCNMPTGRRSLLHFQCIDQYRLRASDTIMRGMVVTGSDNADLS